MKKVKQKLPRNGNCKIETRYGLFCVPDVEQDLIGRFLQKYGEWAWLETQFVSSLLPDNARVLDAGAYIGTFGLGLLNLKKLQFVAFVEGNPNSAKLLRRNLAKNANCTTEVIQAVLAGADTRAAKCEVNPSNRGGTIFRKIDNSTEKGAVSAISLKKIWEFFGPFDLIKLDIEGMEQEVLLGEQALLETKQTTVWVEANATSASLSLAEMFLEWNVDLYYFAFPSFNPNNYSGSREPIFTFAYEAGLLASPRATPVLSSELQEAGCILRRIEKTGDLKEALWRTPRWGLPAWHGAKTAPELTALVGHSLMNASYDDFLSAEEKVKSSIWAQLEEQRRAVEELRGKLADAQAETARLSQELAFAHSRHAAPVPDFAGVEPENSVSQNKPRRRRKAGAQSKSNKTETPDRLGMEDV
jgi:FkbM family methyltransferase